jgi:hypothetical protein
LRKAAWRTWAGSIGTTGSRTRLPSSPPIPSACCAARTTIKFGGEGTRHHFNTRGATDERVSIFFDGSRNTLIPKTPANAEANVLADLMLGLPYQATITTGEFGRGYRQWAWSAFAQMAGARRAV